MNPYGTKLGGKIPGFPRKENAQGMSSYPVVGNGLPGLPVRRVDLREGAYIAIFGTSSTDRFNSVSFDTDSEKLYLGGQSVQPWIAKIDAKSGVVEWSKTITTTTSIQTNSVYGIEYKSGSVFCLSSHNGSALLIEYNSAGSVVNQRSVPAIPPILFDTNSFSYRLKLSVDGSDNFCFAYGEGSYSFFDDETNSMFRCERIGRTFTGSHTSRGFSNVVSGDIGLQITGLSCIDPSDNLCITYRRVGTNQAQVGKIPTAMTPITWQRRIGGNPNVFINIAGIASDSSGRLYLIHGANQSSQNRVFLSRLAADGSGLDWSRAVQIPAAISSSDASIIVRDDFVYYCVNFVSSSVRYNLICKYDLSGNIIWQREIQDGGSSLNISDLYATDEWVYFVGRYNPSTTFGGFGGVDGILIKIKADGSTIASVEGFEITESARSESSAGSLVTTATTGSLTYGTLGSPNISTTTLTENNYPVEGKKVNIK